MRLESQVLNHPPNRVNSNLTVDLSPVEINRGAKGSGFRVKPCARPSGVKLWKLPVGDKPDPALWWDLVQADNHKRFRIAKGSNFYILRSKERLSLPPGVAVYARAIDEEIGEMRIHYAGFAHPWFGWDRKDKQPGTPLIFEVRGHDVDVNLRDGEILARLQFFRMSQDEKKGGEKSYGMQTLTLSGYWGKWQSKPNVIPGEKA